ncbi:MAG: glutamate racemase [Patescibacteria group bacterium]
MIGICDSGVGGLIVYQKLKALLPNASFVYLADQAYAPYGERTQAEIIARMKLVIQFLVDEGATMVVIACNTATVNAVDELRSTFPATQLVGMEPAIKPAAAAADKIIVLGTNSTVHNARYRALVDEYAAGKTVWNVGAPELVRQVETGELNRTDLIQAKVQQHIEDGAQALVIGCSHFSFLIPTIEKVWPDLQIFDGAEGVARQAVKQRTERGLMPDESKNQFYTTGVASTAHFLTPAITFEHMDL